MSKSKAPLVMLEQMVMLLVFALAAALCLQAFVKSDAVSRESEARDRAALLCQSMAEELRTNGGSSSKAARAVLGDFTINTGRLLIPLNEDMTAYTGAGLPYEDAPYLLEVYAPSYQAPGLDGADIHIMTHDGEDLFSLEVLWQAEVSA